MYELYSKIIEVKLEIFFFIMVNKVIYRIIEFEMYVFLYLVYEYLK